MNRILSIVFSEAFWKRRYRVPAGIAGLYLLITIPLVFRTEISTFNERDEARYHYPTILDFRRDWPKVDYIHYRSATTPLYHFLMAGISFLTGSGLVPLRCMHLLFGLACLLAIYRYLKLRIGWERGALFSILLLVSPYFIGPATRLSTDSAAFLFACLAVYELDSRVCGKCRPLRSSLWILLAVLTRQVYAWLIALYLIAYWIPERGRERSRSGFLLHALPSLVPVFVLAYFLMVWQGLTPPLFASHSKERVNGIVPVYVVSLLGFYSFYWRQYFRAWKREFPAGWPLFAGIALFSGFYLILNPVSYQAFSGKGGLLWKLSAWLPHWRSTSVLFWLLFPAGLYSLYLLTRHLFREKDYLMMACFPLWLASNVLNSAVYQKYYDPFLLFFIGCSLQGTGPAGRWNRLLPLLLIAVFFAILMMRSS